MHSISYILKNSETCLRQMQKPVTIYWSTCYARGPLLRALQVLHSAYLPVKCKGVHLPGLRGMALQAPNELRMH